ncbi:hypothetical protein AB1N83_003804 [Pleurotus pulmonarius]
MRRYSEVPLGRTRLRLAVKKKAGGNKLSVEVKGSGRGLGGGEARLKISFALQNFKLQYAICNQDYDILDLETSCIIPKPPA